MSESFLFKHFLVSHFRQDMFDKAYDAWLQQLNPLDVILSVNFNTIAPPESNTVIYSVLVTYKQSVYFEEEEDVGREEAATKDDFFDRVDDP
jgi:hypothetical protein